ncbi:MAG: phage adaptor protein [Planctomycetota bacterium]|jgi:hypothetical protein
MAVEIVSDLEDRIREWTTNRSTNALSDEYIWDLIDEVIDDIMDEFDPYLSFGGEVVARSSSNHFADESGTPTPSVAGVIVNSTQIEAGSVPDNTEYLEYIPFPAVLRRPLDVYYGNLYDNNRLSLIGYDEFLYRRTEDGGGFATGVVGGTPTHWAEYGEAFLLYPTPPFATTITARGVVRPAKISSGGDTNPWITEQADLLRYGVMRKLLLYNMAEDDVAGVMMINTEYERRESAIRKRSKLATYRAKRSKMRKAGTRRT